MKTVDITTKNGARTAIGVLATGTTVTLAAGVIAGASIWVAYVVVVAALVLFLLMLTGDRHDDREES